MKIELTLGELRRLAEVFGAHTKPREEADRRLADRLRQLITAALTEQEQRQRRALRVAVEGHAAEAARRTQTRYR